MTHAQRSIRTSRSAFISLRSGENLNRNQRVRAPVSLQLVDYSCRNMKDIYSLRAIRILAGLDKLQEAWSIEPVERSFQEGEDEEGGIGGGEVGLGRGVYWRCLQILKLISKNMDAGVSGTRGTARTG
jgi:hypothetical protein